jgi:hypothetical protein
LTLVTSKQKNCPRGRGNNMYGSKLERTANEGGPTASYSYKYTRKPIIWRIMGGTHRKAWSTEIRPIIIWFMGTPWNTTKTHTSYESMLLTLRRKVDGALQTVDTSELVQFSWWLCYGMVRFLTWIETFLFFIFYMRPTQLRIQWVPVALSPGTKRQVCEADHSFPRSDLVKNAWSSSSTPFNI